MSSLASSLASASGAQGKEHTALVAAMQKSTAAMQEFVSSVQSFNSAILDSIKAYKPFQVELFTRRLKDLQAVFGSMLLPVMLVAIRYVRMFSDYLLSLSQPFRAVVQGVGKVGLVFGVLTFLALPLIAVLTALTTVFAVLLAVVVAIAIAGAPVVAVCVLLSAVFVTIGAIVAEVVAVLTALVYAFSQTEGGGSFFAKALKTIGDAFESLWQVIRGVWEGLAPFRENIAQVFSELGDALSKLLDAMQPAIISAIVIVIGVLAAALMALAGIASLVAKIIQAVVYVFRQIFGLFNAIFGFKSGEGLAEQQKKKSAFGLAAQGGQISTDVASVKTKIEEMILAQTGREEPTEKDMPNLVKEISETVKGIYEFLQNPANAVNESIGKPIRDADPTGLGDAGFAVGQWLRKQVIGD